MIHAVLRQRVLDGKTGLFNRPWARWADEVTRAALGGPAVTKASGAAVVLDFRAGLLQWVTLTATASLDLTGLADGAQALVLLQQDATGSRTVSAWPAAVRWPGGTAPTLSTAPHAIDLVRLVAVAGVVLARADLGYQP
jgi:hypothetical protein